MKSISFSNKELLTEFYAKFHLKTSPEISALHLELLKQHLGYTDATAKKILGYVETL